MLPRVAPLILLVMAALACVGRADPAPAPPARTPAAAARPPRTPTYAAIGASDTVGVGTDDPTHQGWVYVLHDKMPAGMRLVNLGISGALLQNALAKELPGAVAAQPAIVTVWNVVNDLNARVFLSRYEDDLTRLISALVRDTDARIYVGNVPDLTQVPLYQQRDPQELTAEIQRWNAAVARAAAHFPDRVYPVDLYAHSAELALHKEYVAGDNFHPSVEGHRRLAEVFWDAIQESGGVPQ